MVGTRDKKPAFVVWLRQYRAQNRDAWLPPCTEAPRLRWNELEAEIAAGWPNRVEGAARFEDFKTGVQVDGRAPSPDELNELRYRQHDALRALWWGARGHLYVDQIDGPIRPGDVPENYTVPFLNEEIPLIVNGSTVLLPRDHMRKMRHESVTKESLNMAKPKKTAAPPPPSDFGDIAEAFANPSRPRTRTTPEAPTEPVAPAAVPMAAQAVPDAAAAPQSVPVSGGAVTPPEEPARGRGRPRAAREVKNVTYSVGVDQAQRLDRIAAAEWVRTGQKTSPSEILRALLDRALEQLGDSTEVLK